MSFLKEFKEDLSQAVNELIPEDNEQKNYDDEAMVNTLEEDAFDDEDLEGLDSFFKKREDLSDLGDIAKEISDEEDTIETEEVFVADIQRENTFDDKEIETSPIIFEDDREEKIVSDESAVITKGTKINGDMESDGSLEIIGSVNGNVTCNGKLTITGAVNGNSSASEVFANAAKIEGEVKSEGTVKIGLGSVIMGNIFATSAVIAGAVKGDIDVTGPVVVDASAVIMGNIKSKSVQINNGAVIEGFCSQSYSDINVKDFFVNDKNE